MQFVKTRTRNEALDCRVYAIGALSILNLNLNVISDRMQNEKVKTTEEPSKRPIRPNRFRGNSFVNGWR